MIIIVIVVASSGHCCVKSNEIKTNEKWTQIMKVEWIMRSDVLGKGNWWDDLNEGIYYNIYIHLGIYDICIEMYMYRFLN